MCATMIVHMLFFFLVVLRLELSAFTQGGVSQEKEASWAMTDTMESGVYGINIREGFVDFPLQPSRQGFVAQLLRLCTADLP